MDPEVPLRPSQDPTTRPRPELDECSPHPRAPFLLRSTLVLSSHPQISQVISPIFHPSNPSCLIIQIINSNDNAP